ncbi:MAG: alanine dehydrogenase [Micrococcales bacterium]|nr:alanine dehydrogenase [Micrococcales bacterium]
MKIGVPKEVKSQENRVGMTPSGVHHLVERGHEVLVQTGAGAGSRIADAEFLGAGAKLAGVDDVWADADLIVKVKEPIASEYHYLRPGQTVFTYLHLAADKPQTEALMSSGTTSIAYETVELDDGSLPLLSPMSEVAGRMSLIVGSHAMLRHFGGRGALVPGVPGVAPAKVVVLGAGVAGGNAAQMAHGLRADVTVLDVNLERLVQLDKEFDGHLKTLFSTGYSVRQAVADADIVIGSVLVTGGRAPCLVTHEMMLEAKAGSVWVDISVDQGGCFEDTHPTTHAEPTYQVGEAVVYAVGNMPGAVPISSTYALTNATLRYVTDLADRGWREAMVANPALARGLSTHGGALTCAPVGEFWGFDSTPVESVLA